VHFRLVITFDLYLNADDAHGKEKGDDHEPNHERDDLKQKRSWRNRISSGAGDRTRRGSGRVRSG